MKLEDFKKLMNEEYGKVIIQPTKPERILVHLKDDRNIIINGDEIMFMLNGDLVIRKDEKNVACFKFDLYEWAHQI